MTEKPKNVFLYLSATIANLLGFTAGVAYAWSSPVLPKLKENTNSNPFGYPVSPTEESWIVSLLSLGAIFGPIFAGMAADKFGRKKTLLSLSFPIIASFIMMAFGKTVAIFYAARLIMGLGVGSIFMILPIYLIEIAEDHNRGKIGCLMAVFVAFGNVFAYMVGPYLSVQNFCLICTLPLLIFIPLFLILNQESPVYLAVSNKQELLKKCLLKLRPKSDGEIEKEVFSISQMIQELNKNKGGLRELFLVPSLRKGLAITVGILIFQQFAGINAVLSYMQTIFDATGSGLAPDISSVIIGIIQVCATIVTSSLADKLGRKVLLVISLSGSSLSLSSLGVYFFLSDNGHNMASISWLPIASLVSFIVCFNLGLSSVPWAIMAELFPPNVKSAALTLTTVVCFIGAFIITLCFPSLMLFLGMAKSFWVFAGVSMIGVGFVVWRVPETKGRSLQEIQGLLGHGLKI